jgi:hypothetical protein
MNFYELNAFLTHQLIHGLINVWHLLGESHKTPDGKELLLNLNRSTLHNNNIVLEITNSIRGQRDIVGITTTCPVGSVYLSGLFFFAVKDLRR